MKVALVYDRVNKWGGAERVLLALHKIFPNAPLFTSVYDPKGAPWASNFVVKVSFLQRIPFAKHFHEFFAPLMPLVFETFSFDEFDLVISVSSEAAKGIITKPNTKHIAICLTPTRYLWSGYNAYFKNRLFRFLTMPIVLYLRKWDSQAASRADHIIAISHTVKKRVQSYYKRSSFVVYPPVMFNEKSSNVKRIGNYFLVVSRLSRMTPYKKVDLLIQVANQLGLRLKIVGEGSAKAYFMKIAGPTVSFLGNLTDERLAYYYKHCRALLFAAEEDFGYVMVEANYFGRPVIAYKAGGAVEIIQEGITGEFFSRQSVDSISSVLEKFDKTRYNSKHCRQNAQRFTFKRFEEELNKHINRIMCT